MSKQPSQPVQVPVQPKAQPQQFNLGQSIQSVRSQWCSFKQQLTQSDAYKQYNAGRQLFGKQVCTPVSSVWKSTYSELPLQTTKLKFNYLQDYSFKERFLFLNVLALGGALLTMRGLNGSNLASKSFSAIRNASLSYIFGGLLVAPEIYNPLMNQ